MKYIITESQYKLLSEIERDWRDIEYREQYDKLKDRLINRFINLVKSYDENESNIYLLDSDDDVIMIYMKKSGELYYNRDLDNRYSETLPHPIWSVNAKYIMDDVFKELFPDYEVKSVKSANIL
jgi:hypothetical protein